MASIRRIIFVSFPFIITAFALILLLIATLGGSHVKSVYLFQVDLRNTSVNTQGLTNVFGGLLDNVGDRLDLNSNLARDVPESVSPRQLDNVDNLDDILGGGNITSNDLGLDGLYYVNLWGTCSGASADNLTCTDMGWDWASKALNVTYLENVGDSLGANISVPDEVVNGLNLFATSVKWMQIVFVVALALFGLELILGAFTACSRIMSCLTYVVAGLATLFAIVAAGLATATVVTVVGLVKSTAAIYGIDANLNNTFLGLVWASVGLAVVAGFFWLFSICCCKPQQRDRSHARRFADEKQYSGYQPIDGDRATVAGARPTEGPYREDVGYEPYAHTRV